MIKQSLKIIWKNKRKNRSLLFEFFLSFILLFILISFISHFLYNKNTPLGFNYDDVWMGILQPQKELHESLLIQTKKEIYQRIKSYDKIINLTELHNNHPYVSNKVYTHHFAFDTKVISRVYAFGVDEILMMYLI